MHWRDIAIGIGVAGVVLLNRWVRRKLRQRRRGGRPSD